MLDYSSCTNQVPVVQRVGGAVHRINRYPLDIAIGFAITYPVDSDPSGGQRHPPPEQPGPGGQSDNQFDATLY